MHKYGLLGKTLNYSFSKRFFEDYFQKNNIDARFDNYEIPSIDSIDEVFAQHLSGLTVTIPYKESIIPLLDSIRGESHWSCECYSV